VNQTDALNLWDIETRIKAIHEELEVLHQTKAELLGKKYPEILEFSCE